MAKANDGPQFTPEQVRVLRAFADMVIALTKPEAPKATNGAKPVPEGQRKESVAERQKKRLGKTPIRSRPLNY